MTGCLVTEWGHTGSVKFIRAFILSLALVVPVLSLVLVPAVAISACKTSQATTDFKDLTALQNKVAATRTEWADFVVAERIRIGTIADRSEQGAALLAINAKEVAVKGALESYQAQAKADKEFLKATGTRPSAAPLLDAGNAYLQTVATFKK